MHELPKRTEAEALLSENVQKVRAIVEEMLPGDRTEYQLPVGIDFPRFVSECGRASLGFEIGGVFSPKSRSLIIARGYGASQRWMFSDPSAGFVAPRQDESGRSDDEFWHTHPPLRLTGTLSKQDCLPSDSDNSTLLGVWMIDYLYGQQRPITSTIGCGGFVSTTTCHGINFDEGQVLSMGITQDQLQEVKDLLAIGPPIWIRNLAVHGRGEELRELVERYYTKKHQQDGSFLNDLDALLSQAAPLLNTDTPRTGQSATQRLKEAIVGHHPRYFEKHRLTNRGIDPKIAEAILAMVGIETVVIAYPDADTGSV